MEKYPNPAEAAIARVKAIQARLERQSATLVLLQERARVAADRAHSADLQAKEAEASVAVLGGQLARAEQLVQQLRRILPKDAE